ncbi:MAG: hypothetical protein IJU57_01760 [Clostridia bacterium]|nr:hypothetical protein [Clostridia bacterium]
MITWDNVYELNYRNGRHYVKVISTGEETEVTDAVFFEMMNMDSEEKERESRRLQFERSLDGIMEKRRSGDPQFISLDAVRDTAGRDELMNEILSGLPRERTGLLKLLCEKGTDYPFLCRELGTSSRAARTRVSRLRDNVRDVILQSENVSPYCKYLTKKLRK